MREFRRFLATWLVCLAMLASPLTVRGLETDQYDVPPKPLADIGDEVSDQIQQRIQEAIDDLNRLILDDESCVKSFSDSKSRSCSRDGATNELYYLRSEQALAHAVYEKLGAGLVPYCKIESWVEKHEFKNRPARYKIGFWKSMFLFWPAANFDVSPTVNLYGHEFGTDKFGHIFQQGYTYYKIHNRAVVEGKSPEESTRKAVAWGRMTEDTVYGTLITGVYSNGDLFANYVGLKFYEGLTRDINTGEGVRPAIVMLKNGCWTLNEQSALRRRLLRPFISDHLNEALNPSIFTNMLGLRSYVRRKVTNRSCPRWFNRYPELSQASLQEESRNLTLWHGEDYGFTPSEHFITIANACFEEDGTPRFHPMIAKNQEPKHQ